MKYTDYTYGYGNDPFPLSSYYGEQNCCFLLGFLLCFKVESFQSCYVMLAIRRFDGTSVYVDIICFFFFYF